MKKPGTFEESINAISSEISFIRLSREAKINPYAALAKIQDAVHEGMNRYVEARHAVLVQNEFRRIAAIAIAAMIENGIVTRRDVAALFPNIATQKTTNR